MIKELQGILQEIKMNYSNKIDSLLEEMNVENISELTSISFEDISIEEVEDIAYYSVNEYDNREANVNLYEFNTEDINFLNCQGGNLLVKCQKKDKNKSGYIILYNDESGITLIKIK